MPSSNLTAGYFYLCLFRLVFLITNGDSQLFHSVARMNKAMDSFQELADQLEQIIAKENQRLSRLERYGSVLFLLHEILFLYNVRIKFVVFSMII